MFDERIKLSNVKMSSLTQHFLKQVVFQQSIKLAYTTHQGIETEYNWVIY